MDLHTCSYHCERPECIRVQRDELRNLLERLEAQRRSADYVLVPREPTLEMIDAAKDEADCMGDWYRAMIAAAPHVYQGTVLQRKGDDT